MTITFSNGTEMPYTNAFSLERDFKDGYTRPSIEVTVPLSATSFEQINSLMGMDFVLVGDADEFDNIPTSEWTGYSIKGKISVDDGNITFKVYRLSETEIERNEAIQAVDELLLTMGG